VIAGFATKEVGRAAMFLGAGRQTKEDDIDMAVGVIVHGKIGERVQVGDVLFTVHAKHKNSEVETMLLQTVTIADNATPNPLVYEVIR
jgi:pyrimidine-nucleoside phosphorylase